ncbi:MAG: hypothetical protein AB7O86_14545 [Porticoccaceae bacterium]
MSNPLIGKYVICRTYSAGVHAGVLISQNGKEVLLADSRRLWSWAAKEGVALSGLAVHGLKTGKIDSTVPHIYLTEAIELIECSADAQESLNEK